MKKKCFIFALLLIILFSFINILYSRYGLIISSYKISTDKFEDKLNVLLVSDLHNSEFGKNNYRLINKAQSMNPDLICISGDLLNKNSDSTSIAENLITQLEKIAPVYFSMGNHEYEYQFMDIDSIINTFTSVGAICLDKEYTDIEINGINIRIGGVYGYCSPYSSKEINNDETLFLEEFQNTQNYKILLSHMPYCWNNSTSLDFWDVDLVLCGHTHGGQVRIPFVGGLYAPDIGLFPGKEKGVYYSKDNLRYMVLSTGLGNTESLPRFNNFPEVVSIKINSKSN